jgi:hypothetical protein
MTRRRQGATRGGSAHRRRLAPILATVAGGVNVERLNLSSYGRTYAAAAGLLVLVIGYLLVGTQVTQTSYELDSLKDRNTQLVADQGELRAQDARIHTEAGVAQSAASAGLQRGAVARYVGYQPAALDLQAPIGPVRQDDTPLWQRALAFLVGGTAREAEAAGG